MSSTLTWASSGLGVKTGTTVATLFDDLNTLVVSKVADATFKWQVASVNSSATPFYLVLKRKDASAGRILLVNWTSTPAANNAAILDQTPTLSSLFGAWFPAGNTDTPLNLTAASGTILGVDTGVVKVWPGMAIATIYAASFQPFYFDSAEGCVFGFQNPAAASPYMCGAGDVIVDNSDAAYGCTFSYAGSAVTTFGSSSSLMNWSSSTILAGGSSVAVRTNYGAANRAYFHAFAPTGVWANQAIGPLDILTDTAISKAWFAPMPLLGQVKGEGMVLKLRQIAMGPATTGALATYNTTGPVVAAIQFNAFTSGGTGYPWMTNFKL
jgi:hypothetical protein